LLAKETRAAYEDLRGPLDDYESKVKDQQAELEAHYNEIKDKIR